jgi:hypothetical protein
MHIATTTIVYETCSVISRKHGSYYTVGATKEESLCQLAAEACNTNLGYVIEQVGEKAFCSALATVLVGAVAPETACLGAVVLKYAHGALVAINLCTCLLDYLYSKICAVVNSDLGQ